jgi:hypothetical protein
MAPPICESCMQEQLGIVHLFWSEGAVVYQCAHCGAFNEIAAQRTRESMRGAVRTSSWGQRDQASESAIVVERPRRIGQ